LEVYFGKAHVANTLLVLLCKFKQSFPCSYSQTLYPFHPALLKLNLNCVAVTCIKGIYNEVGNQNTK